MKKRAKDVAEKQTCKLNSRFTPKNMRRSLAALPPGAHVSPDLKAGLTLVEVMIASGLMVLALTGFMTAFTVARRSAVMAMYEMQATHTARQALETLAACSYQDPKLNVGTRSLPGLPMSNSYTVVQNGVYPLTKDVQITVYWKVPGRSRTFSRTVSTSITSCLHKGGI